MQMMDEMKSTPSLEIEHVICTNPENFVLTTNNMQKLRELRDSINETLNSAREAAKSKREKLIELYNYLELPEDSCQAFLNKHSGCSLPDLHAVSRRTIFYLVRFITQTFSCIKFFSDEWGDQAM